MAKKKVVAWYEGLNIKFDHVTAKGNLVCKKLTKKDISAIKAGGHRIRKIPSGHFVISEK